MILQNKIVWQTCEGDLETTPNTYSETLGKIICIKKGFT